MIVLVALLAHKYVRKRDRMLCGCYSACNMQQFKVLAE
jgi:hypothetical protein